MSRATRLLTLLQVLRRHRRPVIAAELAAETGVSLRTLYRDIAALVADGAPIEGAAGLGYVLRPGFTLPPLMFAQEEVEALMLGLRLVGRRTDPALARAAADALGKIVAVLPPGLADATSADALLAGPGGTASAHLPAIRAAIRAERRLRLDYADADDQRSDRVVSPVAVGFFAQTEVCAAFCHLRDGYRHFRLDRIMGLAATEERFARPHRILLAEWRREQGVHGVS